MKVYKCIFSGDELCSDSYPHLVPFGDDSFKDGTFFSLCISFNLMHISLFSDVPMFTICFPPSKMNIQKGRHPSVQVLTTADGCDSRGPERPK